MKTEQGATEKSLLLASKICRILAYLFTLAALVLAFSLVIPYVEGASRYQLLKKIQDTVNSAIQFLHTQIPTKVKGHDLAVWILIAGALALRIGSNRLSAALKKKSEFLQLKKKYEEWKDLRRFKGSPRIVSQLDETLTKLEHAKAGERDSILKQFIEMKKKLDSMGRDLAFLSIDVVDSTKMKLGEEKAMIEHDFKEFKQFVKKILDEHGVVKSTWTPDGVMSCFERVDQAVSAGRKVIDSLEHFNRNIKTMRFDFAVRCGVNSGFVYLDDTLPLEEIADRVIDIAGHFQKHATPNTIWIAKPSIEPLAVREGFYPAEKVIDGYEVYEWKKD